MVSPLSWGSESDVAGGGDPPVGFSHQGSIPWLMVGRLPQMIQDVLCGGWLLWLQGGGLCHSCQPANGVVMCFSNFIVRDAHCCEVPYDILNGGVVQDS